MDLLCLCRSVLAACRSGIIDVKNYASIIITSRVIYRAKFVARSRRPRHYDEWSSLEYHFPANKIARLEQSAPIQRPSRNHVVLGSRWNSRLRTAASKPAPSLAPLPSFSARGVLHADDWAVGPIIESDVDGAARPMSPWRSFPPTSRSQSTEIQSSSRGRQPVSHPRLVTRDARV